MNRSDFTELFKDAIDQAVENAEKRLRRVIPRTYVIELHGAGQQGGRCLDVETAAAELYIDPEHFYRVIDIAVIKVGRNETVVFVRASSHHPGNWNQSWDDPPGMGPFKQLEASEINVMETNS